MDQELSQLFTEWTQQIQRAGESLAKATEDWVAANQQVYKIAQTLMVREMLGKIKEVPSDNESVLN